MKVITSKLHLLLGILGLIALGGGARSETRRNVLGTKVAIVMLTSWRRGHTLRGPTLPNQQAARKAPTPIIHVATAIGQHPPRRLTTLTYGSFGGTAFTRRNDVIITGAVRVSVGTAVRRSGVRQRRFNICCVRTCWVRSWASVGVANNGAGMGLKQLSGRLVTQHTRRLAAEEARVANEMGCGLEGSDVGFDIERIVLHNLLANDGSRKHGASGIGAKVK